MSEALSVNTAHGVPTLSLNDGATATYDAAESNLGAGQIAFDYKAGASDSTPFLEVTSVNLNSAVIQDADHNNADFTLPIDPTVNVSGAFASTPLQIGPSVADTVETSQIGTVADGQQLLIEINTEDFLDLNTSNGLPTLQLNDGGTALFDSGSYDPSYPSLVFSYTVGSGAYTPDLEITSVYLNGATVADTINGAAVDFSDALNTPTFVQLVSEIVSAGLLTVSSGQTSGGLDIVGGGTVEVLSGGSIATTFVSAGGSAVVDAGGSASGTIIYAGGSEFVAAGGSDLGAQIWAHGVQSVSGVVQSATVDADGLQVIASGGTASGTIVSAGGTLEVFGGGKATDFTINSGGVLELGSGASLSNYQVRSGAVVEVESGASIVDATVFSGSTVETLSGGVADPTTVAAFGTATFAAGSTAAGLIINGGLVQLLEGASVSGPIVFDNYNEQVIGTLAIADASTAFLSGLVISGLGADGLRNGIELTNVAWTSGAAAEVTSGFLDVSVGGSAYKIGLSDPEALSGAKFSVEFAGFVDGGGVLHSGTEIIVAGPMIAPKISAVTDTATSGGILGLGVSTEIDLQFNEPVIVSGAPMIKLSDGGSATYNSAASVPESGTLQFDYTVGSGQNAKNLTIAGIGLTGGASIKGLAGEFASLALTSTEENLHFTVDGVPPKVTSVTTSPSSGIVVSGQTVSITVGLTESVTVSGAGPVLELNDGDVATYASSPTSNSLLFTYDVGTETTAALKVIAVESGGTVTDVAGNALPSTLTSALKLAVNTDDWKTDKSGLYGAGTNWSGGTAPTSGEEAVISIGGTYTVSGITNTTVAAIDIADTKATLLITSGSYLRGDERHGF